MEITRKNFVDMKNVTTEVARAAINNPELFIQHKRDGTAGIVNVNYIIGKYEIIGRGIEDGQQQNYTQKFFDIIPGMEKFCDNISNDIALKTIAVAGEIVYFIPGTDRESIRAIETRCHRKNDIEEYGRKYPATFILFDIIEFNGNQFETISYEKRFEFLKSLEKYLDGVDNITIIKNITSPEEKKALLDKVDSGEFGIEGVVIKDRKALPGEGTYKYKFCETHDVWWEGEFKPGNGRRAATFGSLTCYQYVRGKKTKVAAVGGGFNDQTLAEVMRMINNGEVSKDKPVCMSVQAHEVFEKTGAMRYPNFVEWRFDKAPEQCVSKLDEPSEAFIPKNELQKEEKKKEVAEQRKVEKQKYTQSLDDWW